MMTRQSDRRLRESEPVMIGEGDSAVSALVFRSPEDMGDHVAQLILFPDFKGLHEVPTHGVSVGLGTIRRLSRQVALLIHGAGKRSAVKRLKVCRGFDPTWPASFIFECKNPLVLLDQAAMQ